VTSIVQSLLITATITIALVIFFLMWIIYEGEDNVMFAVKKKYRALIRSTKSTAPTLCPKHAVELLVTKGRGRMAVLNSEACEVCNKKARPV
jgi:hypothetical protein